MTEAHNHSALLNALYAQIDEICGQFREIRREARGIVQTSQMPDATLHLKDVLQETENAATAILDAAAAIGALVGDENVPPLIREGVERQLGTIYEASSFQDISGQRIKKVLNHLNALEVKLNRLSEATKGQELSEKPADPLLNGPQLTTDAPSQTEIDNLFRQA